MKARQETLHAGEAGLSHSTLYLRDPESEKLTREVDRPSKGRFLEVTIMYVICIHIISVYLC